MTKKIYEWTVEEIDDNGDIVDSDFYDEFPGLPECGKDIGVVCYDLGGRFWAYVDDGELPQYFEDAFGRKGPKVPARFHSAIKTARKAA